MSARRILALVEGSTEEQFFQSVVAPHLGARGIDARVTILCTKRVAGRRQHRGGMPGYAKFKKELGLLLRTRPALVTTMVDFYALPADYPGVATVPRHATTAKKQRHLHDALGADVADARFFPNVMMHEYEAFAFADIETTARHLRLSDRAKSELASALAGAATAEDVNDGPDTHPSRRLEIACPAYEKVIDGRRIAESIGLGGLATKCPLFGAWLKRLESV